MEHAAIQSEKRVGSGTSATPRTARQETPTASRFTFHYKVTTLFDGVDRLHRSHSKGRIVAYNLGADLPIIHFISLKNSSCPASGVCARELPT
jgi:hypothetical protein